jgi:DNA-binding phage protein
MEIPPIMVAKLKPKLTLVQQRTANSAVANIDDEEVQFLEDLRGAIWGKAGATNSSFKVLADNTKMHARTISRFASGETKRPQLFTIRKLLKAVGLRMTWAKDKR